MNRRRAALLLVSGLAARLAAQTGQVYVCPMDPDVRSNSPGVCPRCGMTLVAGISDSAEYPVELTLTPHAPRPGEETELAITVREPRTGSLVEGFQPVHERLFHLFAVSRDLEFFAHEHPDLGGQGVFRAAVTFPRAGEYRLLCNFYPDGGTPQSTAISILIPGAPVMNATGPERDYTAKDAANLRVSLRTDPEHPLAGMKTELWFELSPGDGIEKYLGVWGHLLAASDDLIDLIHTHPLTDTIDLNPRGRTEVPFTVYFPRARTCRVWVQFERNGIVNVAHFDVPVAGV